MNDNLKRALSAGRPLILDGAMGTELQRRGVDTGLPMWSANALFSRPGVIEQIHKDYLAAGADIITTNTFRTTRRTMLRANLPDRSKQLTQRAVDLAKRARDSFADRKALIAGSVAPLEDCYKPDLVPSDTELREEHAELAGRLAEEGVDFILIETMNTIREAYIACEEAMKTGKETVVSFVCGKEGNLLSGESLAEGLRTIAELGPAGFSVNCVSPRHMTAPLRTLSSVLSSQTRVDPASAPVIAVYGNVGLPESDLQGWTFTHDLDEEQYASFARDWAAEGVSIIGGCCGTTPGYIAGVARALGRTGQSSRATLPVASDTSPNKGRNGKEQ